MAMFLEWMNESVRESGLSSAPPWDELQCKGQHRVPFADERPEPRSLKRLDPNVSELFLLVHSADHHQKN